ncbi:YcgN family cysteine cluster protein [Magnetospirillum sp. 15-1]|uniref:YcgN family cysteine cluster protein n=1 Tax=Magnetospirillum sp. 15-1 TaxID=1979370 RepID=UPI000BBCC160|nr:YcgN family cysteine cluster protein [Magnetospirillum sp. 15-1]
MSANSSANTTRADKDAEGPPFWRTTPLSAMTREQWESLCDGCGRCCLHKLEDADTGEIHYTNVACRLLNLHTCGCKSYAKRWDSVPDCVELSPVVLPTLKWLPSTCAYRVLSEGKVLQWWHPLVSGDPETVHRAGISVRGKVIAESRADLLDYHVVTWPE